MGHSGGARAALISFEGGIGHLHDSTLGLKFQNGLAKVQLNVLSGLRTIARYRVARPSWLYASGACFGGGPA